MNKPKVSVLMTAYNDDRNNWLDASIQSILTQSYGDFELVIVDDCSVDDTLGVIKKYKKIDNRIKIVRTSKNVGLTKALNVGLNYCHGEYVVRQDADDVAHPFKIEKQVEIIESDEKVGIVGCWYAHINIEGNVVRECHANPEVLTDDNLAGSIAGGSPLIRWSVIEKLDGYDDEYYYAQDVDLWIRTRQAGWILRNAKEILYYWRVHPQQRSSANRKEQIECAKKIVKKLCGVERTKWE